MEQRIQIQILAPRELTMGVVSSDLQEMSNLWEKQESKEGNCRPRMQVRVAILNRKMGCLTEKVASEHHLLEEGE